MLQPSLFSCLSLLMSSSHLVKLHFSLFFKARNLIKLLQIFLILLLFFIFLFHLTLLLVELLNSRLRGKTFLLTDCLNTLKPLDLLLFLLILFLVEFTEDYFGLKLWLLRWIFYSRCFCLLRILLVVNTWLLELADKITLSIVILIFVFILKKLRHVCE